MSRASRSLLLCLASLLLAGGAHAQRVQPRCVSALPATVEMNTVVVGDLVKSVVLNKEIFSCFGGMESLPPPRPSPNLMLDSFAKVIDVQLFTELVERRLGDGFETVEILFKAALCKKFPGSAALEACGFVRLPVLDPPNVVSACRLQAPFAGHPVAMNTVVVGDLVKTIKAQTEVFRCPTSSGEVYADLTTFTEIFERSGEDGFESEGGRILATVCYKRALVVHGDAVVGEAADPVTLLGCQEIPVPPLQREEP